MPYYCDRENVLDYRSLDFPTLLCNGGRPCRYSTFKQNIEAIMSRLMLLISVVSTIVFALLILIKLGVPVIVAVLLALVAGYTWWRFERAESEERSLADYLCAFMDFKSIFKYVNQLF